MVVRCTKGNGGVKVAIFEEVKPQEGDGVTWGDYGRSLESGAHGLGGSMAAAGRWLAEKTGNEETAGYYESREKLLDMKDEQAIESMSDEGRKRLGSSVSSMDFWAHPFSAGALKLARSTPAMAASIVPAALLPGIASIAALGVAGGGTQAADYLDHVYREVDKRSDTELQELAPYYRGLRAVGMDEPDARKDYAAQIRGHGVAINFAVGALANTLGPAGQLTRGLKGGSAAVTAGESGALARAGLGAGEAGTAGAAQAGTSNATVQNALVAGQLQKEFDSSQLVDAVLEGFVTAAPLGAAAGAKFSGRAKDTTDTISNTPKGTGTGTPIKPVDVTSTGNPDSAPTRSERIYAKPEEAKAKPTAAPEANGLDPDIALAREQATAQPKTPTTESEVVPPAQRTTSVSETPPPPDEPGALPRKVTKVSQVGAERPVAPVMEQETAGARPMEQPAKAPASEKPPQVSDQPVKPERKGPRVLEDLTTENRAAREEYHAQEMTQREQVKAENKALAEATAEGPKRSHKGAEHQAKKEAQDKAADEIVERHTPIEKETDEQVLARARSMVDEAKQHSVEPKKLLRGDKHAPAMVILREAADLVKSAEGAKWKANKQHRTESLSRFRARELAARMGEVDEVLGQRRSEGDTAKRGYQGDVETKAAPVPEEKAASIDRAGEAHEAAPEFIQEKDNDVVQTAVPKSGKGSARLDDGTETTAKGEVRAKAASPVRKVEITPELKAKYGAAPKPKVTAKVAEVAAKAKEAKAEKAKPRVLEDVSAKVEPKEVTSKGNGLGIPPKFTPEKARETLKYHDEAFARVQKIEPETTREEYESRIDNNFVRPHPKMGELRKLAGEPTEAQKIAGNYPKKHIKVHGLDISIENERGSTRSKKDANGKELWSVEMPDDYGYIKRTSGADGDQVDVYVGKNHDSDHVLVIDQQDHATGKFDEHKVMLGYDDASAALDAYERAFSDGKGLDRVGAMHPMSVEEFKQWLRKGDTTAPVEGAALQNAAKSQEQLRKQYEDQHYRLGYRRAKEAYKGNVEPLFDSTEELRMYHDDLNTEGQVLADKEKAKREKLIEIYEQGVRDAIEGKPNRAPPLQSAHRDRHVASPDRELGEAFKQWPVLRKAYDTLSGAAQDALGEFMQAVRAAANKREMSLDNDRVHQNGRELNNETHPERSTEGGLLTTAWLEADQAVARAVNEIPHLQNLDLSPEHKKAVSQSIAAIKEVAKQRGTTLQSARREADTQVKTPHPLKRGEATTGEVVKSLDNGETAHAIETVRLDDFLKKFDFSTYGPLFHFIRGRVIEAIGDRRVHLMEPADMARLWGEGTKGLNNESLVHPGLSWIAVNADLGHAEAMHTVIHESAHGITVRAIHEDPVLAKRIRSVMDPVREALKGNKEFDYAFTNEMEFIAEAWGNRKFQRFLKNTPISNELARQLGLPEARKYSAWHAFVNSVRQLLRLPDGTFNALEAAITLTEKAAEEHFPADVMARVQNKRKAATEAIQDPLRIKASIKEAKDALMDAGEQAQKGKPWALALRTTDQIAQAAAGYFKGNETGANVVRRIADTIERIRTGAEKRLNDAAPIIADLHSMEKKYQGPQWTEFTSFVHEATMAGAHPDVALTHTKNEHLHFKKTEHMDQVWSRAQHPDLAKRYQALPADLKEAYHTATDYFTKTQNAMSLGIIHNRILKALGHDDVALSQRIFDGTATDADKDTLGAGDRKKGEQVLKLIEDAKELSKIKGPYVPLMRRGDYVVRADHDVAVPAGAKRIEYNVVEFADRKEAERWTRAQDMRTELEGVWVDKNTGETEFPDGTRVTSKDTDAEQRFRATVQNRHVEFFETEREARLAARRLESILGASKVKGVEARQYEPHGKDANLTSGHMSTLLRSLQRREGWSKMTDREKETVKAALNEASIRFMGSTRIQSRRLPRTYVAGASHDLVRNTYDYSLSSSSHLSRLEHAPVLEKDMKEMREVSSDHHKTATLGRSVIANEVEKRVDQPVFEESKGLNAWTKRVMTASFLDKLMGPSHSIINSLQPSMVTMPVLAGRHGVTKAFSALRQAYSDVGGLGVVKQGLKNTAKKFKPGAEVPAFMEDIIARAAKTDGERAMFRHLLEVGSISPDSGLEVSQLIRQKGGVGGKVDTGLGYLEGIAREMPRAIEAINRATTALAAYRLETSKGVAHDTAVRYAQETTNNTQFLYSHTNRAKWMNHPLAKLTLQFRQYGQGIYHILGMNIGRALTGATRQERMEAVKTLTGIAATHVAMAGALGLPLEPFKYLLLGMNTVGITNTSWGDVEDKVRRGASSILGKTGGELATRGLPRLVGVDLSTRVGLDSLTSFGGPRSNKDTDVKSWLFDTLAGAPVSLAGDWVKGSNALMSGEFEKAAELLIPVKTVSDSLRAYRQATEGKKSSTSGRETMSPYTPYEAATRALGFTPAREAEAGAQASAFYGGQARAKEERQKLVTRWLGAKPGEKTEAFAAVTRWNNAHKSEERIKMQDLTSAAQKRVTELKDGTMVNGIRTTKRDRNLLENSPYNVLP